MQQLWTATNGNGPNHPNSAGGGPGYELFAFEEFAKRHWPEVGAALPLPLQSMSQL